MIFVTGGTGLVGTFLLRELVRLGKSPIRALRRENSDISGLNDLQGKIEWVTAGLDEVDLLYAYLEGVTQVYHCAAEIGYSGSGIEKLYEVNAEGTANLVNAALYNRVQQLLYVSSIAAIGANPDAGIITENSKWEKNKINTDYGISKMLGEREVWRGMAEGISSIVVNPGIILGPAKWRYGAGRMWRHVDKGSRFYVDSINGYVDVRDVVQQMIHLMEKGVAGERYILVAGNYSIKQILEIIAGQMNRRAPTIRISARWLTMLAWEEKLRSLLTGSKPIVTPVTARLAGKDFSYSNEKIKDLLQAEFIPLQATVAFVTEAYFRERRNI